MKTWNHHAPGRSCLASKRVLNGWDIAYHDGEGASWAQYPKGFRNDGLAGMLRQLMHHQADGH
jgi:hypothetical protein